jgi:hypothetical protein
MLKNTKISSWRLSLFALLGVFAGAKALGTITLNDAFIFDVCVLIGIGYGFVVYRYLYPEPLTTAAAGSVGIVLALLFLFSGSQGLIIVAETLFFGALYGIFLAKEKTILQKSGLKKA